MAETCSNSEVRPLNAMRATGASRTPRAIVHAEVVESVSQHGRHRVSAGPGSGVMVFFGTGRYQYQQDNTVVTNPQLQSLYGIFDNLDAAIPSQANVGGRGSLARQVVSGQLTTDAGQVVRNITRNVVNYYGPGARRGWYMDLAVETGGPTSPVLNAVGERFIATPRIQSGRVFFTTYTRWRTAAARVAPT